MPETDPTTVLKTLKVRVKDRHVRVLRRMAVEVNQVWNYCNALQRDVHACDGKFLSGFDFHRYTVGASREFDLIGSSTVQEVAAQYAVKRRKARKVKLRWRTSFGKRRSLGWVPFKARAAKWRDGMIQFAGIRFRVWDSYGLGDHKFRAGCFAEDARGRWYFCVAVEVPVVSRGGTDAVGVDLGLKDIATTSDGDRLEHGRWYRKTQEAVGKAQRARKPTRVRALHAKVKNQRKDALNKWSRSLVNRCSEIHIGDVSPSAVGKTRLARSVYDSGWGLLKATLRNMGAHAGIVVQEVPEHRSTQTCSSCGEIPRSSPKGRAGLGMREWTCGECGARHDRDVNAARNILAAGHCRLAGGIPSFRAGRMSMDGGDAARVAARRFSEEVEALARGTMWDRR